MSTEEQITRPRHCSTCKRPTKGHMGPIGSQCQNLPPPRLEREMSPLYTEHSLTQDMDKSETPCKVRTPSSEEYRDLLRKVNQLLDSRQHSDSNDPQNLHYSRPSRPTSEVETRHELPYFAEQVPIPNELYRKAVEGCYIDLNQLAHVTDEESFVLTDLDQPKKTKKRISSYLSWAAM